MYVPAHFAVPDDEVPDLLASLPFGELVTSGADGLEATPLPWVYDPDVGERGALIGHLARTNPQWRHAGSPALVLLRGPDHYVSPGWLPSKDEHGRVVPTWDYVTVHAYGELVAHDDPDWVREAVRRLTARHEAGQEAPWRPEDAPERWLQGMVRAVVGVEVVLDRWVAKAKMAQNKTPADVEALVDRLDALGERSAASYTREVSLPAARRRAQTLADVARRRQRGD